MADPKRGTTIPAAWPLVLLLISIALAGSRVQTVAPDSLYAYDAYFHIRQAWLMRQGRSDPTHWFQFSIYTTAPVDPEYGFHWALMPFTLGDLFVGGKVASVLGLILFTFVSWWVLTRLRVAAPTLWVGFGLVCFPSFFLRMTQLRPFLLTTSLFLLGLYGLVAQRGRVVGAVVALWTWAHIGYPLLLGVVLLYGLLQRITRRRFPWSVFFWVLGGWLLGLALHPEPLQYLHVLRVWLASSWRFPPAVLGIPIPQELQPWSTELWRSSGGLLICYVMSTLFLWRSRAPVRDEPLASDAQWFLWIVVTVLWFSAMRCMRFYEYLVPATILASAVILDQTLRQAASTHRVLWTSWTRQGLITSRWLTWLVGTPVRLVTLLLITMIACQGIWMTLSTAQYHIGYRVTEGGLREAGQWLASHASRGVTVAQTDWADFPELFFYNPDKRFLNGFDALSSYLVDPKTFWRWHHLVRETSWCAEPTCAGPAPPPEELARLAWHLLRDRFVVDYLVVVEGWPSPSFRRLLDDHPECFAPCFRTKRSGVYQLVPRVSSLAFRLRRLSCLAK